MQTAKLKYLGELRVENVHLRSGQAFITDAPVDNHGKGEAFSPTDTVAAALGSCMLTTVGIKLGAQEQLIEGAAVAITKVMSANPRRISKIIAEIQFPTSYDKKTTQIIERTARQCPVMKSLHPDIEKQISFHYGE